MPKSSRKRKIMLTIAVFLMADKEEIKRRKWAKNWLLERRKYSHMNLLRELKNNEPLDFKNYLRMENHTFQILLNLIKPHIEKQNTIMRESISAEERLIATLRFLATGRSYEDLKFSCAISAQSLGKIIPETCSAIYKALKKDYLKIPKSESQWREVAENFKTMWNFDNCLGAMDGKHVLIKKPANSGSFFYNYKGSFSVVLFGIVNANYEFLYVHAGVNGRVSDGGILKETKFFDLLEKHELHIPPPRCPFQTQDELPFVFVGDEAFPLLENIMKPYQQQNLDKEKRIFNYRLSRARRVVENAFGIMASRFRVFLQPLNIDVSNVDKVILASCVLHNYLRKNCSNSYSPVNYVDMEDTENGTVIPGQWRQTGEMEPLERTPYQASRNSKMIRDKFKHYFSNEGRVSFQERMIER